MEKEGAFCIIGLDQVTGEKDSPVVRMDPEGELGIRLNSTQSGPDFDLFPRQAELLIGHDSSVPTLLRGEGKSNEGNWKDRVTLS
jgi:hypothetical protein